MCHVHTCIMPRVSIEFRGAFVHCTTQQVRTVLEQLGLFTGTGKANSEQDVSAAAAASAKVCLSHLVVGFPSLYGQATRNFGTAL